MFVPRPDKRRQRAAVQPRGGPRHHGPPVRPGAGRVLRDLHPQRDPEQPDPEEADAAGLAAVPDLLLGRVGHVSRLRPELCGIRGRACATWVSLSFPLSLPPR